MFDIREPALLIDMLKIIASQSGNVIEYQNLARSLNITRQTVSNYMMYLKEAFLVNRLQNYTASYLASTRKAKKFYLQDHALMNMLLGNADEILSDIHAGKIMENICVNHLDPDFFWRRNYEVDIILKDENIVPIEIKYSNDPSDIKGLDRFMKKFNIVSGVVITKDILKLRSTQGEILFIPAWLFLSTFCR